MIKRAVLLLLMLLPLTAKGREGSIVVDPGDNPLVIKGWVGDENSFIGNIGVTLQGAAQDSNPVKLNVYRSDLKMAGGTEMIGRQSVAVTGDQTLAPDATSTYQVKVTGVKEPGEYRGRIDLLLAGQRRDAAVSVEVVVVASVRPALSLLTENDRLQANLVNCDYDCKLAHFLLPASAFQCKIDLGFEKPLAAPLVISDITIAVKGDHTKFKLTAEQLKVSLDQLTQSPQPGGSNEKGVQPSPSPQGEGAEGDRPMTVKKYLTLPVAIASHDIPADHYNGSIYLTVAGQSNSLKVPVDFNVRSGPLWPLLILLASILLGRLFKFMQDKGNAIANALESINRLEFRLRDAHTEDSEIITPMLRAARDLVHQDKAAEAAAAVNAISARLSTLGELGQINARLTGKESNPAVASILSDIRQAREHIRLQQDDKAKALVSKIKDALVALTATPATTDSDTSDLADAVTRADAASAAAAVLGTVRKTARHRLRNWLTLLSGLSDEFRAEATLFLARPILWLALLLGLLALGLKTIYVDNPIFGANPFTDFLGLMFWGLSADMASRTLSGLRIGNASRAAGG
jgi:F0F1-type ATP synthase membrane subunit b/b'